MYPLHEREEIVRSPTLCFPVIKVDALCASVHHKVDGASASQQATAWNDSLTAVESFLGVRFVEKGCLRSWSQMNQVHRWVGDGGVIVVVLATFD